MINRKILVCFLIVVLSLFLMETGFSQADMKNKKEPITSFEDFEWFVGFWEGEVTPMNYDLMG